ncbi:NAD(P)H-binding protein [Sphingomonas sp. AR_OL41]|uniref:SDR family oxidoreductase n=1 Tax=Sphingomonas sp. AR_OL41 TaxID=3042729 RepID=UPI00247FDA89|nr:NAD(P)H-binding protein [Sphingomonas sp. AR_OL41]MDH7971345.1 NAD(P)H-binding protein [Sphingomonas sp. AR_OL41]
MSVIAMTGGTGFVGARLIQQALDAGHELRALTRRPQAARPGLHWIEGALDDSASLAVLVEGADAVIHVAGVVNAPDRAGFAAGNIAGTEAMLAATEAAGIRRFVHVSSLAAREPDLSTYGWSKAEAEARVVASSLDWTVVRPPAVYGPSDMEMREMFRIAQWGLALLPSAGRLSVIHVDDLAALLLVLAESEPGRLVLEADDGVAGGWTHRAFGTALGAAVGKRVLPIPLPRALLTLIAHGDRLVRGTKAKLTPDRVDYFCHPDWTVDPTKRPPTQLWQPKIATPDGLAATAKWYRENGLL